MSLPSRAPISIPSLDGIRAISFLVVFAAHAGADHFVPGGFGVTVFFFLSGYLITTLLRVELEDTGTVGLRRFYIRRAFRILPSFYVVLCAATALSCVGVLEGAPTPTGFLAQALHLSNVRVITHGSQGLAPGTEVFWSLAVEEHFYLVFPLLLLGLARLGISRSRSAVVLVALCVAALAWRLVLVHHLQVEASRTYVGTDTRADSILFGCALALWGNPLLDETRFAPRTWQRLLLPGGLALLALCLAWRAPAFRETWRYTLQGIGLVPLFVCAVRFPSWGPFALLNTRALRWLGVLSYGLYLVHRVVLHAFEGVAAPAGARGLLALVVCLALAWALHLLVERPAAVLRARWLDPSTRPVVADTRPSPAALTHTDVQAGPEQAGQASPRSSGPVRALAHGARSASSRPDERAPPRHPRAPARQVAQIPPTLHGDAT